MKKTHDIPLKPMREALALARRAARQGEVPVGAVLTHNGKTIAASHNLTRTRKDPTAHAEVVALQMGAKALKNERLLETVLYVTKEPCVMCAGAIVQARIPIVVYGAPDPKAGACGSAFRVLPSRKLNHRPLVLRDVLGDEGARLLKSFFRRKR